MVGFVVSFLFIYILLQNYRRGVIAMAMTIQLLSYLGVGIPGLKIFVLLCLVSLLLFPLNRRILSDDPYPKPLVNASIFFIASFLLTTIYNNYYHLSTVIVNIIDYFIFPFILWKCIKDKDDILYSIKIFTKLMIFALIVGFIEIVVSHNYMTDLIQSVFPIEDFMIDANSFRYGVKRCNSIFSYFSTYGIACFVSFVVFFISRFTFGLGANKIAYLAWGCFLGAFSTGSRALFLGLFCAFFCLFFQKSFLNSGFAGKLKVFILIFSPVIMEILYMVLDSMINSDTTEYASGSSSELRLLQWEACFPYFCDSPWLGNGRMYIWDVVKEENFILLGAESIWFSILVDYGILGGIAFINLIVQCSRVLFSYNWRLICLPIGYFLILCLSPDSGIQYNILLTFVVILIKMYKLLFIRTNIRY